MNPIEETYTCIPCLGYDDFLALTLPSVTGQLREVYVVTHPDDSRTIKVALRFGARLIVTKAWRSEEGLLDKGAAINCWMESTVPRHRNSWVLTLDADIFLPPGLNGALKQTRPGNLYSARRRLCTSKSGFARYESGQADMRDFDTGSTSDRVSAGPSENTIFDARAKLEEENDAYEKAMNDMKNVNKEDDFMCFGVISDSDNIAQDIDEGK